MTECFALFAVFLRIKSFEVLVGLILLLPHLELKLVVGKMLEKSFHDTKLVQFINKLYCVEKILKQ